VSIIDHEYTSEMICPYCGYKFQCSYELFKHGSECADGVLCIRDLLNAGHYNRGTTVDEC
jgi:hypothetical protein